MKFFGPAIVLIALCAKALAVDYPGNGGAGFGTAIGGGSLRLTQNGSVITGTITKGPGGFNDVLVIYIDTGIGGPTSTSGFTDNGGGFDALRKGISGYDGFNRSVLNFPSGFTPAYAIALSPNPPVSFGGLWSLANASNFQYLGDLGLTPSNTPSNPTYTFTFNLATLGLTGSNVSFRFVTTYLNGNNAYRSNESLGISVSGSAADGNGNFGYNPATAGNFQIYPVELLYGITDSGSLFSFSSNSPGNITTPTAVSGLFGGALVAIDFRPATGQLYGLVYAGGNNPSLYLCTINPQTYSATLVPAQYSGGLYGFLPYYGTLSANDFSFDFDPVADRIRLTTTLGHNALVRPGGTLQSMDTRLAFDQSSNGSVQVVATAYSNNIATATQSTLYGYNRGSVDSIVTLGGLGGNPAVATGKLFPVGSVGSVAQTKTIGMDISGATGFAYLNAEYPPGFSGDDFFVLDLSTGVPAKIGKIGNGWFVRDIAVKQDPPSALPERTVVASNLPQDISGANCNFIRPETDFEVPYHTGLSVYVEVLDPSPSDVTVSIYPSSTLSSPKDVRTLPSSWPILRVWDHEPLVDQSGQPVTCTDDATGQQVTCLKTLLRLPQYAPNGQRFFGDDVYTVQVLHDVPDGTGGLSCNAPIVGKFTKARLTVNSSGDASAPSLALFAGATGQPIPSQIDYGDSFNLLITATAAGAKTIARTSVVITDSDGLALAKYQQLGSGAVSNLPYPVPYLVPGSYQIAAKAVDSEGCSVITSAGFSVRRLFGIFSVSDLVRVTNGDGGTPPGCSTDSVNFSANLHLMNTTAMDSRNLRVRLLEVGSTKFLDAYPSGPPPPATPANAFVGAVTPLAAGASETVPVSGTIRRPTGNDGNSTTSFHIYAVLDEDLGGGNWATIDSFKVVDGEPGCPLRPFGGPGSGVNDPRDTLIGTGQYPRVLDSIAVTGSTAIGDYGAVQYTAMATATSNYCNPVSVTADITSYAAWAASISSINQSGLFQPGFVRNASTAQVSASYTLSGKTKSGSLPIIVYPDRVTSVQLTNGHFKVLGLGIPNRTYTVEASPDLVTQFTMLGAVTADSSGLVTYQDPNSNTKRFYRLTHQ
ncbi:MAG: DUF4394 domain-containing protein [Chthoniobacterales bacterium]